MYIAFKAFGTSSTRHGVLLAFNETAAESASRFHNGAVKLYFRRAWGSPLSEIEHLDENC